MEIAVDTNYLQMQITEMRDALGRAREGMAEMYDQVNELDAMWDGPANATFNQQFLKDKNMMEEMCSTIEQIIVSMENAKREYEGCESDVRQIIAEIRI